MRSVMPSRAAAVPTILSTPSADGSVRCGVCAHRCLVRPGRMGICGVRENRDGQLVSLTYGAVVATGLDPIEKKPLFHVAPGSTAYSIATAGCPFHCTFCQNWEIAQGPRLGLELPARSLPPASVVAEAMALGAGSVAYTYVEPTVFLEYALDTGRLARRAGLRNLFITDGYATPEAVELLATVLDAANVDLKSFDDAFYRKLCGARLAPVLDSIVAMRRAGIWLELTTLVIPGRNDDDGQISRHDAMDRGNPRPRNAVARQPLLPGAPDVGCPADPARVASAGGRPGTRGRAGARLRRQRPRARPRGHGVCRVRTAAHPASRLPGVDASHVRRHVSRVRTGARGPRPEESRRVGPASAPVWMR